MPAVVKKRGFTLIELSIAIAFLSMLLLIIVNTTKGITSTYSKGLSMKKINSVGRDLIDEFTETVVNSSSIDPKIICAEYYGKNHTAAEADRKQSYDNCIADNAYKFIYQQHVYDSIISYRETITQAPAFGMFCAGTYSYIWNTGYTFDNETFLDGTSKADIPRVKLKYYLTGGETEPHYIDIFRILKIHDPSHIVCANQLYSSYPAGENFVIDVTGGAGVLTGDQIEVDITENRLGKRNNLGPDGAPEELITTSEFGGLAMYQFVIYPPSVDTYSGNRFYSASFVLGTLNSGATINPSGDSCAVPPGYSYDTDYCALNKFNFAIRATGGN